MPRNANEYSVSVLERTMDFKDQETVAELYQTVKDSREKTDFVHHEEAHNFLDEIVEQLHDEEKMTDDLFEKVQQLEHIYVGRQDVTDHSDYWTQFTDREEQNWKDLVAAVQAE